MLFLGLDQTDASDRSRLSNTGASLGVEGRSSNSASAFLTEGDLGSWNERRGDITGMGGGEPDALRSLGVLVRVLIRPFDGD